MNRTSMTSNSNSNGYGKKSGRGGYRSQTSGRSRRRKRSSTKSEKPETAVDCGHDVGCHGCGSPLPKGRRKWCSDKCRLDFVKNHRWTSAKRAMKAAAARYLCARCGKLETKVEVNHIVPCLGKHDQWGCHHHLSNLEVVCVPCHRKITAEQRAQGLY